MLIYTYLYSPRSIDPSFLAFYLIDRIMFMFSICSTFGNLESSTEWLEVVFNIIVLTSGLLLVTMLIGNIKVIIYPIPFNFCQLPSLILKGEHKLFNKMHQSSFIINCLMKIYMKYLKEVSL